MCEGYFTWSGVVSTVVKTLCSRWRVPQGWSGVKLLPLTLWDLHPSVRLLHPPYSKPSPHNPPPLFSFHSAKTSVQQSRVYSPSKLISPPSFPVLPYINPTTFCSTQPCQRPICKTCEFLASLVLKSSFYSTLQITGVRSFFFTHVYSVFLLSDWYF